MADIKSEEAVCKLCGQTHGNLFRCTSCSSAERMLNRRVGQGLQVSSWTEEDAQELFRHLKEKRPSGGGSLNWATVRAALVTRMAERRLQTFLQEVQVEVLPKSVLLVRGWEENTLAQFEQVWSDLYNCHAYKVPVQRMTWSDAHEYAEEQVLEHERQCAQRRGKKGDEALDVPSAPTGKDPKGTSEAAQGKKVRAANVRCAQQAAKALGPLTQAANSLTRVLAQAAKARVGDPGDVSLCEETGKESELWRKACSTVVQTEEQNKQLPETAEIAPLTLPGATADWKQLLKKAAAARAALHGALPKREPKKKAEPKADAEGGAPAKRRRTKGA